MHIPASPTPTPPPAAVPSPPGAEGRLAPNAYWVGTGPYRMADASPPPHRARPPARTRPLGGRELAAGLAIGAVADACVWGADGAATGGLGLAVFLVVVPALVVVAVQRFRVSLRLIVVSALLAALAARAALAPTMGTALAGLACLFAFALTLRGRRTFAPEMLASAFAAVAKLPSRARAAYEGTRRLAARTRVGNVAVLPVVVPLALSAVFAGVFALANPVVAHGLGVAWQAVSGLVALPSPLRVLFFALSLVCACTLLRPAIRLARGSEHAMAERAAAPGELLVARNALAAVNALFLAYNALDAAYLWSGAPPAGSTTQAYAHQGAFWLTIALAMLTAVIGFTFRGSLAHDPRARTARILAYTWMVQGLVLALGTYRRIAIHVAHSGLSDLRIVAMLGTTLVVFGVVAVALKLRGRHTFRWLLRRQIDAFALTVAVYTVFPTHFVAARVNVARIQSGEYGPVLHMFRQSATEESAAELVPLLAHRDERVRQGVAALLDAERERLAGSVAREKTWRERDVVSRRTLAALEAARPRMREVLDGVDESAAREALLEVARAANDGLTLEEILSVPSATRRTQGGGGYRRGDF